jgi:signal transduction histidine kinase
VGRILLADDNADMRAYIQRLLAGRWSVEAVADGEAALQRVRQNPPDLVLSDVMMPRLDGLGLLRALRADEATRTIPVIMISARAGEEARIEGLDWGADDYLVKPFSAQELIARVSSHLKLSRLRKESEAALRVKEAEVRALNTALEARVRDRTARMAEALQELETFSYTVAHDLRGPLRAMSQFSDMLIEDFAPQLGEEGQEYARRISQASQRMDQLTTDLLEYSRVSTTEVAVEPIDLRGVAEEVLASSEPGIRESGGRVEVAVGGEQVRGNRFLLIRALTNLLENALKFVRPGVAPLVRIRTERGMPGRLRLWIEDNGIGIDPAYQSKLFKVFERLDPAGPHKGTGIGLAIVRKAVERMGGTVGVESSPGKGSRFFLDLASAGPA